MFEKIHTPAFLRIGDPMYIDEPTPNRKKYVLEKTYPSDFVSSMQITKGDGSGCVQILICIAPNSEALSVYQKEEYYSALRSETVELGCDTACFRIETDEKDDEISTMSDGYYGFAVNLFYGNKNYGSIISLSIDEDVYDQSTEDSLKYVFYKE